MKGFSPTSLQSKYWIKDIKIKDITKKSLYNKETKFWSGTEQSIIQWAIRTVEDLPEEIQEKIKWRNYKNITHFQDGYAVYQKPREEGSKIGVIDINGNEFIDGKYQNMNYFTEWLATVNKYKDDINYSIEGWINTNFEELFMGKYERCYSFTDGYAVVIKYPDESTQAKKGLQGWIDKNGNEFLMGKYSETHSFSEGMAHVVKVKIDKRSKKWNYPIEQGWVDTEGNEFLMGKYYNIWKFKHGYAKVTVDETFSPIQWFIDKEGNEHLMGKYRVVREFEEDLFTEVDDFEWNWIYLDTNFNEYSKTFFSKMNNWKLELNITSLWWYILEKPEYKDSILNLKKVIEDLWDINILEVKENLQKYFDITDIEFQEFYIKNLEKTNPWINKKEIINHMSSIWLLEV